MPQISGAGRGRIHLLDELRGFAVFCMVFYHGFYTLAFLYNLRAGMILLNFFMPAEPYYAGLFMLISGISSNLSHSNLVRGVKLLGVALAITLITYLAVPEEVIVFGILHFLSVCMILYGLLKPVADRFRFSWAAVAVCAVLYLCTMGISSGYLGLSPQLGLFRAVPVDFCLRGGHVPRQAGRAGAFPRVFLSVAHPVFFLDRAACPDHLYCSSTGDLRCVLRRFRRR